MTQLEPSFSCRTDGLTPDSKILWYTEEMVEAAQVLRLQNKPKSWPPPPPCQQYRLRWSSWVLFCFLHFHWALHSLTLEGMFSTCGLSFSCCSLLFLLLLKSFQLWIVLTHSWTSSLEVLTLANEQWIKWMNCSGHLSFFFNILFHFSSWAITVQVRPTHWLYPIIWTLPPSAYLVCPDTVS